MLNLILLFITFNFINGLKLSFTDYPDKIINQKQSYDITWNSDLLLKSVKLELWQLNIKIETLYETQNNERFHNINLDYTGQNYSLLLNGVGIDNSIDNVQGKEFTITTESATTELKEDESGLNGYEIFLVIGPVLIFVCICFCGCYYNCSQYKKNNDPQNIEIPQQNQRQQPPIYNNSQNSAKDPNIPPDSPPSYRSE